MQKRIKTIMSIYLLITASIIFYSCSNSTVVEPPVITGDLAVRTIKNLPANADSSNRFTYFRFSDSSVVTGVDTVNFKWDIAFKNTTIIINGSTPGGSGIRYGSGGAIVYTASFDTISVVPALPFAVDTTASKLAITPGSGNGWYTYDFVNNIVNPILTRTLIIRTGDGKYAKVEILSYYKDSNPQPNPNPLNYRYYTFKYVYQPDGSLKIK